MCSSSQRPDPSGRRLRRLGLAMRRGGPQGQTEGEMKWSLKGRADLRAPKRSACRRQEAPKQQPQKQKRPLPK
ncbi:hypothetical protein SGRA_2659 [Saprospira grandis str. Lewin]|uniref:Uncharacterized protein n=1 Tax=Saprospira grandis (strain Lewin) TaxID=984262 RepID=H6L859_SAPGL|nr:hypothetical protein SGRA_2659 [Saprospira grandis str. Lewin]